jgi:hypothetical protein
MVASINLQGLTAAAVPRLLKWRGRSPVERAAAALLCRKSLKICLAKDYNSVIMRGVL